MGEKMHKAISKSKLVVMDCGKFSADKPKGHYECIKE